MAHLFERLMAAQDRWAKPFGDFNNRWLNALFRPIRPVKDFLNGTWIGHPVHAALTDAPVGIFAVVIVLDVLGYQNAADVTLVVGILAMVAAAVAGLADYTDTDGTARTRATLHATLMVASLVVYLLSFATRVPGPSSRGVPIGLSILGFALLTAGAFVGGDVVYRLGNMVNRHAWRGGGAKWLPLELAVDGELPEGVLTKAKLGINNLVLVRQGETVLALHEQCAHAGGPLSQGAIVGGSVECPWHGSRFRLTDGRLQRGPALYDQPAYEVRHGEHGWEGRRAQT
ncbi:MAG TPA: Rieske (2Fe-2S) protein [Candidatus Acidoferrum sp.]|nr:Rieske (2Fe-2S) protein [Candidatus Acidoferrum sp.]